MERRAAGNLRRKKNRLQTWRIIVEIYFPAFFTIFLHVQYATGDLRPETDTPICCPTQLQTQDDRRY